MLYFGTAEDTAEVILLKALILQLICLYQKVVPHLVSQCKFDFSKLLKGNVFGIIKLQLLLFLKLIFSNKWLLTLDFICPGIVSEKGIKDEVPPVLQHHVLQLALDLPASKFSWFRMQVRKLNSLIYFYFWFKTHLF